MTEVRDVTPDDVFDGSFTRLIRWRLEVVSRRLQVDDVLWAHRDVQGHRRVVVLDEKASPSGGRILQEQVLLQPSLEFLGDDRI